jgi:hypothetical protein
MASYPLKASGRGQLKPSLQMPQTYHTINEAYKIETSDFSNHSDNAAHLPRYHMSRQPKPWVTCWQKKFDQGKIKGFPRHKQLTSHLVDTSQILSIFHMQLISDLKITSK